MTSTSAATPDDSSRGGSAPVPPDAHPGGLTVDEVAAKVFAAALASAESMSIYVGDRLGWYRSLAEDGAADAATLAARTGTHPRYAREWLEFQAVHGYLQADRDDADDDRRQYTISPQVAEVMLDGRSLSYLGPLPRMLQAAAGQMPALLNAYRHGGGVSWDQFGDDARECQAVMNRPWLERELAPAFATVPDLHAALGRPGARIAEIGFGAGWSTIGLARAYPQAVFDGFDVDPPSVDAAQAHAAEAGVDDRVRFRLAGGAAMREHGPFDVALAFECVHDLSGPVEVLRAVRESLAPGGVMIVMDEAVADEFSSTADDLERFMYACSLFICLPDGMSSEPSAGTGTVMRRRILERYAAEAGFTAVDVLPIENFNLWRFYRLS